MSTLCGLCGPSPQYCSLLTGSNLFDDLVLFYLHSLVHPCPFSVLRLKLQVDGCCLYFPSSISPSANFSTLFADGPRVSHVMRLAGRHDSPYTGNINRGLRLSVSFSRTRPLPILLNTLSPAFQTSSRMDGDTGAVRSRKLFSWRSKLSKTRRFEARTQTTDTPAVSVSVSCRPDSTY